jgi:hypothetical protein
MSDEVKDYFNDADLATPENLPENVRILGEVTEVDVSGLDAGNWRQFKNPLKDGRTSVPMLTLVIQAKKFSNGQEFDEEKKYYLQGKVDFWMGEVDKGWRAQLARLCMEVLGIGKDEARQTSIREMAKALKGAVVSFTVKWQPGETATFQRFMNLKAANEDERALLM